MKIKKVRYSIEQGGKFIHSLGFYYNPNQNYKKSFIDGTQLSHAKKTLDHCRRNYPGLSFKIIKTVTITEVLEV